MYCNILVGRYLVVGGQVFAFGSGGKGGLRMSGRVVEADALDNLISNVDTNVHPLAASLPPQPPTHLVFRRINRPPSRARRVRVYHACALFVTPAHCPYFR